MSNQATKRLRNIAHTLKPIVTIGDKGLTDTVILEVKRALNDHELIKITVRQADRDAKKALIEEVCKVSSAELIQTIGHVAVLYKKNPTPDPRLSNILRSL